MDAMHEQMLLHHLNLSASILKFHLVAKKESKFTTCIYRMPTKVLIVQMDTTKSKSAARVVLRMK